MRYTTNWNINFIKLKSLLNEFHFKEHHFNLIMISFSYLDIKKGFFCLVLKKYVLIKNKTFCCRRNAWACLNSLSILTLNLDVLNKKEFEKYFKYFTKGCNGHLCMLAAENVLIFACPSPLKCNIKSVAVCRGCR